MSSDFRLGRFYAEPSRLRNSPLSICSNYSQQPFRVTTVCTTNHCALSHCSEAKETAPKISHWYLVSTSQTVFFLMETSHRHVGDGSLHRKCFIVSVLNLRCSIMKEKGEARAKKVLCDSAGGESETPIGRAAAPRTFLESTPAILRECGNPYRKLQTPVFATPTSAQPRIVEPRDI
jgi:hypothetical protein